MLLSLTLFGSALHSQCFTDTVYKFTNPSLNSGTYKFTNVLTGVDAYITPLSTKNATLDSIDAVVDGYDIAWQPIVKITNTKTSASDSSYVEFLVEFKTGSNLDTQDCLVMTVVDHDGVSGKYKEMIKASLPVYKFTNSITTVTWNKDSKWFNFYGRTANFSGIDTASLQAMVQLHYTSVQRYKIRIGSLGKIDANTTIKHSLYFSEFDWYLQPLMLEESTKVNHIVNEEPVIVDFYDNFGKLFYTGTYENFIKVANSNTLYFTAKGVKYIKLSN